MRGLSAVVAVAVLGATNSSAWSRSSSQQETQFRARTDVVVVPVSVMKGRDPVLGLTIADFELTDNGVHQIPDAASLQNVGIDITLVLTEFPPDRDREFLRAIVSADATRNLSKSTDRLRIVTVDGTVNGRLIGPDYNLAADPAVKALQGGVGIPSGFKVGPDPQRNGNGGVALADALFYSLAWPVDADRRHVVIAFTDGWDTASALEMDALPGIAGRSDAVLHAVLWATPQEGGTGGGIWTSAQTPSTRRRWEQSYRALDQSVQRTGGTLQRTQNAAEALTGILADFRSSYVLRYTPQQVPTAGWHEIKVTLKRPGSFSIRARKGYEVGPARK